MSDVPRRTKHSRRVLSWPQESFCEMLQWTHQQACPLAEYPACSQVFANESAFFGLFVTAVWTHSIRLLFLNNQKRNIIEKGEPIMDPMQEFAVVHSHLFFKLRYFFSALGTKYFVAVCSLDTENITIWFEITSVFL